jgi:hypothetical protein
MTMEAHNLRAKMLFDYDDEGVDRLAENEYLKALALLDQAKFCLRQAQFLQENANEKKRSEISDEDT